MKTRLVRNFYFTSLHRYENPTWDENRNRDEFGACFTKNGHGHSYRFEVCVQGEVQPETGMVINLKDLDKIVHAVLSKVDKKHLNFEVDAFKEKNPTTENLLQFLNESLRQEMAGRVELVRTRLFENDDLWVEEIFL